MTLRQKKELNKHTASITIRQALEDMKYVESHPYMAIDMHNYCQPVRGRDYGKGPAPKVVCTVCFADAVMVNRFSGIYAGITPGIFLEDIGLNEPGDDSTELHRVLYALDSLRCYDYAEFMDYYYGDRDLDDDVRAVVLYSLHALDLAIPYSHGPKQFKQNMETIADILESHGL